MRPNYRKKNCKNFENWPSNSNFCLETNPKNSRKGVFDHFWIGTKKKFLFLQIFKPGQLWVFYNGIFRCHLLYQSIDTLYFFKIFEIFSRAHNGGSPPKVQLFSKFDKKVERCSCPPHWIGLMPIATIFCFNYGFHQWYIKGWNLTFTLWP